MPRRVAGRPLSSATHDYELDDHGEWRMAPLLLSDCTRADHRRPL